MKRTLAFQGSRKKKTPTSSVRPSTYNREAIPAINQLMEGRKKGEKRAAPYRRIGENGGKSTLM